MAKYKDYILLGVEMEGGWNNHPPSRLGTDGSIRGITSNFIGEVRSEPMRLPQLLKWVENNHPDQVNATCGLHIHVSLNNLDTLRLCDEKFYAFFLGRFEEWGIANDADEEFWKRLRGDNEYCRKTFAPDKQIIGEEGRYTQLNFCAYQKHKTVECRMLPMFSDKYLSMSAIFEFVKIVKDYLKGCNKEKVYYQKVVISEFNGSTTVEEQTW